MNTRFLEAFVWSAQLGSFTATAQKLYATQAAISQRIASLEEQFGTRLFDREGKVLQLTSAGKKLLPLAQQIIKVQQAMYKTVHSETRLKGTLRIGVIETLVLSNLPDVLHAFSNAAPDATVELYCDFTPRLQEDFLRGSLDMLLCAQAVHTPWSETQQLFEWDLCWACSPELAAQIQPREYCLTHALEHWLHLEGESAQQVPLLLFHPSSSMHHIATQYWKGENAKTAPQKISYFSSLAAMLAMAERGLGVGLFPCVAMQNALQAGRLQILPVKPDPVRLPLFMSYSQQEESSLTQCFATVCHQIFLSSAIEKTRLTFA